MTIKTLFEELQSDEVLSDSSAVLALQYLEELCDKHLSDWEELLVDKYLEYCCNACDNILREEM